MKKLPDFDIYHVFLFTLLCVFCVLPYILPALYSSPSTPVAALPTAARAAPTNTPYPMQTVPPCSNLDEYGETVTCKIPYARCEYFPATKGSPTFCNDAPYPNHTFALVVFGQDWSDYDRTCMFVTGELARYDGKPQIIADSRSQVEFCH